MRKTVFMLKQGPHSSLPLCVLHIFIIKNPILVFKKYLYWNRAKNSLLPFCTSLSRTSSNNCFWTARGRSLISGKIIKRCKSAWYFFRCILSAEYQCMTGSITVIDIWKNEMIKISLILFFFRCVSSGEWITGRDSRISLGMGSANGRRRYNVTSSLIGWAHSLWLQALCRLMPG